MKEKISDFRNRFDVRNFEDQPTDIADAFILFLCVFMLVKFSTSSFSSISNLNSVILSFGGFLTTFAGMILVISNIEKEKYLKPIAVAFLILLLITSALAGDLRTDVKSDVDAFSVYSADLFVQGENPYEKSMKPSLKMFEKVDSATPMMDGGEVENLSYPALSFLFLVPQVALNLHNPFLSSGIFVFLTGLLITIDTSPRYSPLSVLIFHFVINTISYSTSSFVWIFLTLLGMRYWESRRYLSLGFLGLAFGFKQTPWFIAPFLFVWIIKETKNFYQGLLEVSKQLGFLGTIFTLINLPFMLINFEEWLKGVFTPMSSTGQLTQLGEGFVQLSLSLGYLPNSYFTSVMLLFIACLTGFYWLYFNEIKWIAWITPALILWFNYRSAAKYMIAIIPLFVYSYYLKKDSAPQNLLNRLKTL